MSILSKDKIKKLILPHLSKAKRGKSLDENLQMSIVSAIFHRLKTGCQWRELPIERYFSGSYSYQSVFYHFNRWAKDGTWQKMWLNILRSYKHFLDLSSVQFDGSHARANRGGQAVGYQVRKADQTTNFLYLCDNQGILVAISDPISGHHHDLADIKQHFERMLDWLSLSDIRADGLFLNADAGFDSTEFRTLCHQNKMEPNIAFNTRNNEVKHRFEYFDELLYQNRYVIERAFAWLDAFKALLIRYETSAINWLAFNILGMIACFIRKIAPKLKC
jgi:transposase